MLKVRIMLAGAAMVALASSAEAQKRGRAGDKVPPGHMPPAGLCRVWIDGVPPGHQPAATDCATAIATRPANARVLYGDDSRKGRESGGIWTGRRDDGGIWTTRRADDDDRRETKRAVEDGRYGDWIRGRTDGTVDQREAKVKASKEKQAKGGKEKKAKAGKKHRS